MRESRILWTGGVTKKLGLIEPAGSTEIVLEAVPMETGLQVVFSSIDTECQF